VHHREPGYLFLSSEHRTSKLHTNSPFLPQRTESISIIKTHRSMQLVSLYIVRITQTLKDAAITNAGSFSAAAHVT